jgi:hypothetical protein
MKEELERPSEFYHGSPHVFDKFDIEKVGTGDGLNKFGFGLYFSDNYSAAVYYAKELSIGDLRKTGFNIYVVKLLGLDDYVEWDSEVDSGIIMTVANKLRKLGKNEEVEQLLQETEEYNWSFRNLYSWLEVVLENKKNTSQLLYLCGINGVKTQDHFHGGNIYVAFSDTMVKIIDVQKIK